MTLGDETRRSVLGLASQLLDRLRDPALRELEVREGGVRVRVAKDAAPAPSPPSEASPSDPARPARGASAAVSTKAVAAPLTGIYYRSPSPQAPPFVQVGSVITPGDVIGLIEAMKLFNEVRSTVAGRVVRLVAENGQLVRAHQPLIELE